MTEKENTSTPLMCRACEIYGPDQHPCCEEVDSMGCVFEVEDTRAHLTQTRIMQVQQGDSK